jgi:uncharacterized protein YwgA
MLFRVLGDYESYFGGGYTKVSLQKIVYFLQVLGLDFGLKFEKNIYGPYSSTLAKALVGIGKANGFVSVDETNETVRVSGVAYSEASDFIEADGTLKAEKISDQLAKLIAGFESAFGLELLSSVHYLASSQQTEDLNKITSLIHNWSERKRNLFDRDAISNALKRLKDDKVLLMPD